MSEIIKSEAIVLSKLNYGDTSNIVSVFTKDRGKLSLIIKGGRSPKSKLSNIVDPLNYVEIVFYNKESRDVQLLSGADIISHFSIIKNELESLKYAMAVIEIVKNLTVEHEKNEKLFRGLIRILNYFNEQKEYPAVLFGRFLIFFLEELGFELQLTDCQVCGNRIQKGENVSYNFEFGFLCNTCSEAHLVSFNLNSELFNYIFCLKHNITVPQISVDIVDKANIFLERYIKYHIPDFKGIKSLSIYN